MIYWAKTTLEMNDKTKYSGSNSCYGVYKENVNEKFSWNNVEINTLGPVRQFLEENVKLTPQLKPFN